VFLVLEEEPTEFGQRLQGAARGRGLTSVLMTSAELVHDLALAFYISHEGTFVRLRHKDWVIETPDIEGVYCSINAFSPALWKGFSPRDAVYAAQETQALWLALLTGLPCRVVNPPALDSLAGTLLPPHEILCLAHGLGLRIPTLLSTESGDVAAQVLSLGVAACCVDWATMWSPLPARKEQGSLAVADNPDHMQLVEALHGRPVWIAAVDSRFHACTPDTRGSISAVARGEIPREVTRCLQTLQKRLNLVVAEYAFRVMTDGTWVFTGCARVPSYSAAAYGDALFERIVAAAVEKGR
jgi:hypothetical protein